VRPLHLYLAESQRVLRAAKTCVNRHGYGVNTPYTFPLQIPIYGSMVPESTPLSANHETVIRQLQRELDLLRKLVELAELRLVRPEAPRQERDSNSEFVSLDANR